MQLLAPEDGVKSRSAATLVVVAATLVTQWAMELKKHAPTLMVITYHGPSRKSVRERDLLRADVVLTSYPMIRYMTNVMEAIDWHRIILDGTLWSISDGFHILVYAAPFLARVPVRESSQHGCCETVSEVVLQASVVCHRYFYQFSITPSPMFSVTRLLPRHALLF